MPDGLGRSDEGHPVRESLEPLLGREPQTFFNEAQIVVFRILDLTTESVTNGHVVVGL